MHTIFKFNDVNRIKEDFDSENFAYIPNFLDSEGLNRISRIKRRLTDKAIRKDFLMEQSNNTPRHLAVIGGNVTNDDSELTALYRDPELIDVLSLVTGKQVCECPELIENIIFTTLTDIGDTHGWHLDDFPIAFILGIESPSKNEGGLLEFYCKDGSIKSVLLKPGDAYIMRSDVQMHRVSPLLRKTNRTILNFTYTFSDLDVMPNGSAFQLCA